MNTTNMTVLTNIIGAVEAGGQEYGKRKYNAYAAPYANSPEEHTVTLGWAQNYGYEAKKLVQMIYDMDPTEFAKYDTMGSIKGMLAKDWVAIKWSPTARQKSLLISIIDSPNGHVCQDKLFAQHMAAYIADCEKEWTSSVPAVMMYCEIRHLGGKVPADRIFKRLNGDYSLDAIMASLIKDQKDGSNNNQVGDQKYWSRHLKCRQFIDQYAVDEKESGPNKNVFATISQAIESLISVALSQLGYLEKKSNANLDDFTANAGNGNYTKYWRDVYPEFQALAWCACFVSWCFMMTFGKDLAARLLKHWPFTYCPTLAGMTANKTPKVGSVILFYKGGEYGHTGIVVAVDSTTVTTIEGNTSGASGVISNGGGVCKKSYKISALAKETKFFMPDYNIVLGTEISKSASIPAEKLICGSAAVTIKHFLVGAVDPQIKAIQMILNGLGYKGKDGKLLTVDGELGENTSYAVAKFQKAVGMDPDNPGTVATRTWEKLLNPK